MPRALPLVDVTAPVCCPPLGTPSQDPAADALQIATRLKALAEPGRIRIVQDLACCEGHEMTTTEAGALLGVSEATANHHLKRLQKAGIVAPRREAQKVYYHMDLDALRQLGAVLQVRCSANCHCA